jgi:hypothetical protein
MEQTNLGARKPAPHNGDWLFYVALERQYPHADMMPTDYLLRIADNCVFRQMAT